MGKPNVRQHHREHARKHVHAAATPVQLVATLRRHIAQTDGNVLVAIYTLLSGKEIQHYKNKDQVLRWIESLDEDAFYDAQPILGVPQVQPTEENQPAPEVSLVLEVPASGVWKTRLVHVAAPIELASFSFQNL